MWFGEDCESLRNFGLERPLHAQSLVSYFVGTWKIRLRLGNDGGLACEVSVESKYSNRVVCVMYFELRIFGSETFYALLSQVILLSWDWKISCNKRSVSLRWNLWGGISSKHRSCVPEGCTAASCSQTWQCVRVSQLVLTWQHESCRIEEVMERLWGFVLCEVKRGHWWRGNLRCNGEHSILEMQNCGVTTKGNGRYGVELAWAHKTSCVCCRW